MSWVVDIAGTHYTYERIHFIKNHPSPDPDSFELTLNGKQTIAWFDYVCIRRYGVIKFVGYVEEVNYRVDEGGTKTEVRGRCRKLILWKKYMERFIDARLTGFFGTIYAHDLFKFLLRCPKSDVPDYDTETWDHDFPRHKIGWGLSSTPWGVEAFDTAGSSLAAAGTHPEYVKLRISGFYWRNRGTPSTITALVVNNNDGLGAWMNVGAAPWLDTDDADTTYIHEWWVGDTSDGFQFPNLPAGAEAVNSVLLHVKIRKTGGFFWNTYNVEVQVNDGTGWTTTGHITGANTTYQDVYFDITSLINTVAEVNAMQVRFILRANGGIGSEVRITYCYAAVDYASNGTQEIDDQLVIDLGEEKSRVCGIIVQSRNSTDTFPRDYEVEISNDSLLWWSQASSPVAGNLAQDIIHGWVPIQCRYIRVRLTAQDLNHAWEVSQVYVYEADDADFTILESTTSPNLSLIDGNIATIAKLMTPFNLPYQRMNDGLEEVALAAFTASYEPLEWWVEDFNETIGTIHFGTRRGSDKSALISFIAGEHLFSTTNKQSLKKTAQRIRVLGKGEGRRQDEITSNWQTDAPAITTANTFYEELVPIKELSSPETANEWAQVFLAKLKDVQDEIVIDVEFDPYTPPAITYDVGDDITVEDDKTDITNASYRIRKMEVTVDSGGEHIILTVNNSFKEVADITNRIASMMKTIRKLELSSTGVEEWTAEGYSQQRMRQDKMENYWEMESQYREANELENVELWANQANYVVNPATGSDANVGTIDVDKDIMAFAGPTNVIAAATPYVYIGDPTGPAEDRVLKWNQDPRFMCELQITSAFVDSGDVIQFGMDDIDAPSGQNRFGFYIYYDGATYTIRALLVSEAISRTRDLGTLNINETYELEAKVDWGDKMIFYKLGRPSTGTVQLGVIPFPQGTVEDRTLSPMWVYGLLDGDGGAAAAIEFYLWKSQGKKEALGP